MDKEIRMNNLTPEQIHILQHSLGLSKRHDKPYRNYYAASTDSDCSQDQEALVDKGLMTSAGKSPVNSETVYYYVTDRGCKIAFEHLPKDTRTPGQKRYERFLYARDVFPDLTFKKFLTDPYFEKAREECG